MHKLLIKTGDFMKKNKDVIESVEIVGSNDIVVPGKPTQREREIAAKLNKLKGVVPIPVPVDVAITSNFVYKRKPKYVELDPFKRDVDWEKSEEGPKTANLTTVESNSTYKDTALNELSDCRAVESGGSGEKDGESAIVASINGMTTEQRAKILARLCESDTVEGAVEHSKAMELAENQGLAAIAPVEAYPDEPYRVGVFLEESFPDSTFKAHRRAITPTSLYEALTAYANTTNSLIDCLKAIGTTQESYYAYYELRFKEIADYRGLCDRMRVNTLHKASFLTYSQDISEYPEIAFKGDQAVDRDTLTNVPLGELSPSWVKFEADKRIAYQDYAKYVERGHLNEKPASITVSQNTIMSNAQDISLEKLEDLDPMEWDSKS